MFRVAYWCIDSVANDAREPEVQDLDAVLGQLSAARLTAGSAAGFTAGTAAWLTAGAATRLTAGSAAGFTAGFAAGSSGSFFGCDFKA